MSNRRFRLEVMSRIDDEMIDRVSERRALFARNRAVGRRRFFMVAIAAALCVCLLAGSITALLVTRKQVPIYLGMTVSTEAPASLSVFSPDALILSSQPIVASGGDDSLSVGGTDEELYYAKRGQDIYITVHISNPDNFEIQSFTLNGKTYSAYMFEKGSDMENLILKYNVGEVEGEIAEYTLDAIKYIDGERIKDVRLDGNRTVKVGVYTEDQPTAEMKDFEVDHTGIGFGVTLTDKYSLISRYGGELFAALYKDSAEIERKKLESANASVTFEGLAPGEIYTVRVIALYDAFDGKGYGERILKEEKRSTQSHAEITGVSVNEDDSEISFDIKAEDGSDISVSKIELLLEDRVVMSVSGEARRFEGVLPGSYTILVTYQYRSPLGDGVGYSRCSSVTVSYICGVDAIVGNSEVTKEHDPYTQVYNETTGDYRVHLGTDLVPRGSDKKVYAAFGGTVTDVYFDDLEIIGEGIYGNGGYGNVVVITSDDGRFSMYYASLDNVSVNKGDRVAAKAPIATVGLAPLESAEDPHLHIELRVNGQMVDPLSKYSVDQIVDSGEIIKQCTGKDLQVYNKTTEDYRVHFAVDIAATRADKNVYAAFSGTVTDVYVDNEGGYGNVVEITSSDGLCVIRYASLDNVSVEKGARVYEGAAIATVGLAPLEEKELPHVHVELLINDEIVDPFDYIKK